MAASQSRASCAFEPEEIKSLNLAKAMSVVAPSNRIRLTRRLSELALDRTLYEMPPGGHTAVQVWRRPRSF